MPHPEPADELHDERCTPDDLDMAYLQNMVQQFVRQQFTVKLAFWLTINRAEGQLFSCNGLLLVDPVFAHGQLYVALFQASSR